jgi:hypothetical protein
MTAARAYSAGDDFLKKWELTVAEMPFCSESTADSFMVTASTSVSTATQLLTRVTSSAEELKTCGRGGGRAAGGGRSARVPAARHGRAFGWPRRGAQPARPRAQLPTWKRKRLTLEGYLPAHTASTPEKPMRKTTTMMPTQPTAAPKRSAFLSSDAHTRCQMASEKTVAAIREQGITKMAE